MPTTNSLTPCIVIGGPTASGKSWFAEKLAERLGGVIINGDSMQVYRGLRVITAQPKLAGHHRLYGFMDPSETCSAAYWRDLALGEIKHAYTEGYQPIIVGGTGLYLKALMEGLSPIPSIPNDLRDQARKLCDSLGADAFHKELAKLDPKGAEKLKAGDTQRTTRAYEVFQATGKSILEWQEGAPIPSPYSFLKILVLPPKQELDSRIEERFQQMVDEGALDEVRALGGLPKGSPALKAIGIPELKTHLQGEMTLEAATERAIIASRKLAKRQSTWFRNQFHGDVVIDHVPEKNDVEVVLSTLIKEPSGNRL